MARLASVAEKSFTGIETIPNETVSVAIDRAAMAFLPEGEDIIVNSQLRCARCGSYGIFCGSSRLRALQRTVQALLAGQGLAPAIPGAGEPLGRVGDPEVEGMRFLELLPGERHRRRCTGRPPRGVGDVERLAAHVHVVVHENLAGALGDAPLHRDLLGRRRTRWRPTISLTFRAASKSSVRS